jgi:hypothetical protein
MTRHEMASLAFKLMGIYALIQAINHCSSFSWLFLTPPKLLWIFPVVLLLTALPILFLSLLAYYLIRHSLLLTVRMFPGWKEDTIAINATYDIGALAVAIVGLLLIMNAIPSLISSLAILFYVFFEYQAPFKEISFSTIPNMIGDLVKLLLGLFLILRSQGVIRLWYKIRGLHGDPAERQVTAEDNLK